MQKDELLGQIGIARITERGEHFLGEFLSVDQNLPYLLHDRLQKFDIALLGGDHALPVPLVDVGRVVVIQEVIFADGAHVGANAFSGPAIELLECNSFPLASSLNYLCIDRVLVPIVRDVELTGSARPVAIEHVVDAALYVDDQRNLDDLQP